MNIMDEGKEIAAFIKKASEKQLLDFLLELRETILNSRAENRALKAKIKRYEEVPAAGEVIRYGKFVYSTDDSDHHKPYCLNCWAFDRKLVPMTITDDGNGVMVICHTCNKSDG